MVCIMALKTACTVSCDRRFYSSNQTYILFGILCITLLYLVTVLSSQQSFFIDAHSLNNVCSPLQLHKSRVVPVTITMWFRKVFGRSPEAIKTVLLWRHNIYNITYYGSRDTRTAIDWDVFLCAFHEVSCGGVYSNHSNTQERNIRMTNNFYHLT